MYYYNKTSTGYNHIKNNKKCQDFSASYHDEERTIITCCDGHGGNIYIRSDLGSKFASEAIIKVFKEISSSEAKKLNNKYFCEAIKLGILCEWNRLVETHLSKSPIRKAEIKDLNENEKYKLLNNKIKAYGTTMIGAMLIKNKLLVVHLGDGESLSFKDDKLFNIFPENEEEPVGNVTYSMCEDDAFSHIRITTIDFKNYDGILLCTDGMVNPYQEYEKFNKTMVIPLVDSVISTGDYSQINLFVENMASNLGFGDDVSLAFITKNKNESKIMKEIKEKPEFKTFKEFYELIYRKIRKNR